MPIDLGRYPNTIVEIKNSEVVHCLTAIHILVNPDHHESLKDWVIAVKSELSPEDHEFIALLNEWEWQGLTLANLIPHIKIFSDLDYFGQALLNLENSEFIRIVFEDLNIEEIHRALADPNYLPLLLEQYPQAFGCTLRILKYIFYQSDMFRQKYINLMAKIKPAVIQVITQSQEYFEQITLYVQGLLQESAPAIVCNKILGRQFEEMHDYKRYVFSPSPFIAPHKLRLFSSEISMIVFPLQLSEPTNDFEVIKGLIKVLDDENRLKILCYLLKTRSYGKVLSEMLGLTTATVSHHLELLKQAGLIYEEREGNIKYFHACADSLREHLHKIEHFLLN